MKFSKRRRAVPLRPIWTIMVAAKLDQSWILVTMFRQNRSTLKGRSAGQRHACSAQRQTERQTDRQVGLFSRLDCAPSSECPQFGMPTERRAQLRVPNVPKSRISERAAFQIYEHAQCRVFERTSFAARLYTSYLAGSKWGRPLCYDWCLNRARAACSGRIALDGDVA